MSGSQLRPAFVPTQTTDRILTLIQSNLKAALAPITGGLPAYAILATYTVPAAGIKAGASFSVNHTLGQTPKAVIPAMLTGAVFSPVPPFPTAFATSYGIPIPVPPAPMVRIGKVSGTDFAFQYQFTAGSSTAPVPAGTQLVSVQLGNPNAPTQGNVLASLAAAPASAIENVSLYGLLGATGSGTTQVSIVAANAFTPTPGATYVFQVTIPSLSPALLMDGLVLASQQQRDAVNSVLLVTSQALPAGMTIAFLVM